MLIGFISLEVPPFVPVTRSYVSSERLLNNPKSSVIPLNQYLSRSKHYRMKRARKAKCTKKKVCFKV